MKDKRAPFFVKFIEKEGTTATVTYIYKGRKDWYLLPFVDEASVVSSIVYVTVSLHLGITPGVLDQRMQQLELVATRLEAKGG